MDDKEEQVKNESNYEFLLLKSVFLVYNEIGTRNQFDTNCNGQCV
jgi:hypothetical protein